MAPATDGVIGLYGLLIIIGLLLLVFVIIVVSTIIKIRSANKPQVVNTPKLLIVPGHEDWEITTDLTVLHIRDGFVYFTDGSYVDLTTGQIRNLGASTIDLFNKKTGESFHLKPVAQEAPEQ